MTVQEKIYEIERPHPNLLKLYLLRCLAFFPAFFISFPVLFFRYYTLRYSFDEEGVSMKWGILFSREINLTYSRIQDIHVHAGLMQRWFRLADLKIQTASGSADAEMVIEGLPEYDMIRDYLYTRMRGYKAPEAKTETGKISSSIPQDNNEIIRLLGEITEELKKTREVLDTQAHFKS